MNDLLLFGIAALAIVFIFVRLFSSLGQGKSEETADCLSGAEPKLLEDLGIEVQGGGFALIIPRGLTLGTSKSQIFSTSENQQDSITMHLVARVSTGSKKNRSMGRYEINNIPPRDRGVPKIEVTLNIDEIGRLSIKAVMEEKELPVNCLEGGIEPLKVR